LQAELEDTVRTAVWVGGCFIFTNAANRLNYFIGKETVTIAHLDRPMYLLGYWNTTNRLYLTDKDLTIVSYQLHMSVIEYQTAVMKGDLATADRVMPSIPRDQRSRVAHFLEKQGFKEYALAVSTDPDHRFDLALTLDKLDVARVIALDAGSEQKWKQLGDKALAACQFTLAQEAFEHAKDFSTLLLIYTAGGKAAKLKSLGELAAKDGKNNIALTCFLSLGAVDECIEILCNTNRLPEAAFFARTYAPSAVPTIMTKWKAELGKLNAKAAEALADPTKYDNLFPEYQSSLHYEAFLRENGAVLRSATDYAAYLEEAHLSPEERMQRGPVRKAVSPVPEDDKEEEATPEAAPIAAPVVEEAHVPVVNEAAAVQDDDDDLDLDEDDTPAQPAAANAAADDDEDLFDEEEDE